MNSIKNFSGKLLLIEHEKDEVIPHELVQSYYDNAIHARMREKKVIPNAPHALHAELFISQSINLVVDWFMRTLKVRR
jgi:hypothetical protein